jgi:hypothetical protein
MKGMLRVLTSSLRIGRFEIFLATTMPNPKSMEPSEQFSSDVLAAWALAEPDPGLYSSLRTDWRCSHEQSSDDLERGERC